MSEETTGKTVYYSFDFDNPPALTREEHEMLARLRSMKDGEIDMSDIPSQVGTTKWTRPGLLGGPVGRLRMKQVEEKVLLLDEDVRVLYSGDNETRTRKMNEVLRAHAEAERKRA